MVEDANTRSRKVLLGCGVASVALYLLGDALMSARYPGYNPCTGRSAN
jgi:hypothetical protein